MAVSEAHKKASSKWNSNRDNIMVRPSKEEGAAIRAAAADAGQSVQAYVLQAVQERMEREQAAQVAGVVSISDGQNPENGGGGCPVTHTEE